MAKIVIADDSPTLRRIVSSVLTREGHEVVSAEDGIGAVQAVFGHQPDAVVLDVQMPRVSGFIAARVLKDDWQTADIPVVMLTSLDAASDRYWAGQAGVDRYLTKDFEAGELAATIAEVLAGSGARLKPDPVELYEEDVLSRVCDLLDRKLFESSVAQAVTAIAATASGLEASVASLLGVLKGFVGYDLAAVLLASEQQAYVAVGAPTAASHYAAFMSAAAEAVSSYGGSSLSVEELSTRVAQAGGSVVSDVDELPNPDLVEMATYLSMPLRGAGGALVGRARPVVGGAQCLRRDGVVDAEADRVAGGHRHRQREVGRGPPAGVGGWRAADPRSRARSPDGWTSQREAVVAEATASSRCLEAGSPPTTPRLGEVTAAGLRRTSDPVDKSARSAFVHRGVPVSLDRATPGPGCSHGAPRPRAADCPRAPGPAGSGAQPPAGAGRRDESSGLALGPRVGSMAVAAAGCRGRPHG